jgi:AraC-like DNA-binding protein
MSMNELERALRGLRLSGMTATLQARALQVASHEMDFVEAFSWMIQDELDRRRSRLLDRRFTNSGLPERKTLQDIDWSYNPKLPKRALLELATLAFIDAEIASDQQGARTVLRRMADVLFIQAVRAYIGGQDRRTRGWLRGLTDRRIARALAAIHEHFAEPWTLDALAREAGMSRTAFAVTFKELVGESPMAYLQRWRVLRAANALRTDGLSLARAAEAVGYQSDVVFAKAFKRVTGESPGRYRRGETPSLSVRVPRTAA